MSDNVYSEVNATNEEVAEFLATSQPTQPQKPTESKKDLSVLNRILSAIFAVAPLLVLCLLPIGVLMPNQSGKYDLFEGPIISIFYALFSGGVEDIVFPKLFDVIPMLAQEGDFWMLLNTLSLYVMPLILLTSFAFGIVGFVTGKDLFPRLIAWMNFVAIGGYVGSFIAARYFADLNLVPLAVLYPLILTGFFFVAGCVLSFMQDAKHAGMSLGIFFLALLVNVVCAYAVSHYAVEIKTLSEKETVGNVYLYGQYFLLLLSGLGVVLTATALVDKKVSILNIVSAGLQLVCAVAILVAYFSNLDFLSKELVLAKYEFPVNGTIVCSIVIAVAALASVALSILNFISSKKEAEEVAEIEETAEEVAEIEATEEEVAEEEVAEVETTEEEVAEAAEVEATEETEEVAETVEESEEKDYIEGVPYEPIALDEEDAEEEVKEEVPVQESKIQDPFILTLTEEERMKFADLFFLKSKGEFVGVPDYKMCEDNSAFFRKVFLYLGKFREMIPDELLGKMYDFYTKK